MRFEMSGQEGCEAKPGGGLVAMPGRLAGVAALTLAALGLQAMAQSRVFGLNGEHDANAGTAATAESVDLRGEGIFREIDDPATGTRWLVAHNSAHPGGPGRLVKAGPEWKRVSGQSANRTLVSPAPVIRAGDHVMAEEHSSRVEAMLEAVALAPAIAGSSLEVRLKMGGQVLRAVALAPGRVVLNSGGEVR